MADSEMVESCVIPFREGDASKIRDRSIGDQRVGAKYKSDGSYSSVAEIYHDKDWFYIVTDPYEGCVMMHRECLPLLIEALQATAAALDPHPPADGRGHDDVGGEA